jgi:hypothetical protein
MKKTRLWFDPQARPRLHNTGSLHSIQVLFNKLSYRGYQADCQDRAAVMIAME